MRVLPKSSHHYLPPLQRPYFCKPTPINIFILTQSRTSKTTFIFIIKSLVPNRHMCNTRTTHMYTCATCVQHTYTCATHVQLICTHVQHTYNSYVHMCNTRTTHVHMCNTRTTHVHMCNTRTTHMYTVLTVPIIRRR